MPASQASITDLVTVFPSTVVTATSTGSNPVAIYGIKSDVQFSVICTAAATAVGDTLDVFIQALIAGTPGAGTWADVVHFTQILGNGGAKTFVAHINAGQAEAMFDNSAALAAGSIRNIIGDYWRIRYVVASSSAPSFTFSVVAMPV